jgi:hypothetical protein
MFCKISSFVGNLTNVFSYRVGGAIFYMRQIETLIFVSCEIIIKVFLTLKNASVLVCPKKNSFHMV